MGQRGAPPTVDVIGQWAIQSRCFSPPPISTTPLPLKILSLFLKPRSRTKRAARVWMIGGGDSKDSSLCVRMGTNSAFT